MITGYYSVDELADVLDKPVLSVAKDLYGLIMSGLVTLKGVRSGKRPEGPEGVHGAKGEEARILPTPPLLPVAQAMPAKPKAAPMTDPIKLAKLNHFTQRIAQASRSVLPVEQHELVNRLLAQASQQLMQGEGPEAVKNLALAISRGVVDAGCSGEIVKNLNHTLKALFSK
jgi:hypothetical protein